MLTLKASVASAILVATIAATAGITYVTTSSMWVNVTCPAAATMLPVPSRPDLPAGKVPDYKGKQW